MILQARLRVRLGDARPDLLNEMQITASTLGMVERSPK